MNQTLSLTYPFNLLILKTKKKSSLKIIRILNLFLISAILVFLIFSIFQIGYLTQEIYLNQDYENKSEKLVNQNEILEIDFSKLNSLSNIEKYLAINNFVKANQIKYIQILESSVVAK